MASGPAKKTGVGRLSDIKDPLLGKTIAARYAIDSVLGIGGSATVYRARDTTAGDAVVALKLMHSGQTESIAEQQRFAREAELAKQLRHPNIVRLLDYGFNDHGVPFLVFTLLVGRSLEDKLAQDGPFGWQETGILATQVLRALEKAHSLDIIHRDIKPANIFLTSTAAGEVVQVLDFGLAKAVGQEQKEEVALTRVGSVVGTPRYMAPEQTRGEQCGQTADIYSFGLVMAEMLTGVPVVQGRNDLDIFVAHGSDQPHALPEKVLASPFAPIIIRAVDKSPAVRYRLAGQMLADVQVVTNRLLEQGPDEANEEAVEGDLDVTRMFDPKLASLPIGQSNEQADRLHKLFNALAAKNQAAATASKEAAAAASRAPTSPKAAVASVLAGVAAQGVAGNVAAASGGALPAQQQSVAAAVLQQPGPAANPAESARAFVPSAAAGAPGAPAALLAAAPASGGVEQRRSVWSAAFWPIMAIMALLGLTAVLLWAFHWHR